MAIQATPDKVYESCLVELHKSLRAASFYSLDHPALKQSLQRTVRYFQNLLDVMERLEFTISKTQISYNDKPLLGQPQVMSSLAGELFRRRMKKLIFLKGVETIDLLGFLRAIKMDPEELAVKGVEHWLAKFGVKAIFANEVDFSRLEAIQDQEEEEEEEEEEVDFNLTPEQQALRELLQELLRSDDAEFMQILKKVIDRCKELQEMGEYDEIGIALDHLFRFANDMRKSVTGREFAEKAIRAVASKQVVQAKLESLGEAGEDERARISMVFQYIGKAVLPFLITALSMSETRTSRRNLSRTIVEFGVKAVSYVIDTLNGDERWFVQRNMLLVLGEIGSPQLLDGLLPFIESDDPRVGKEAVKTLGKIGGDDAFAALTQRVEKLAPSVQLTVATLLGARPYEPAHGVLERLAKRSRSTEEVRVAACSSLGRIGAPGSRRVLASIFRNKGFFQRSKKLPVRRAALKALVYYGYEAESVFNRALKDPDIEIQAIARQALERLAGDEVEATHEG